MQNCELCSTSSKDRSFFICCECKKNYCHDHFNISRRKICDLCAKKYAEIKLPEGVLYNKSYGAFRLSGKCIKLYNERTKKKISKTIIMNVKHRSDPELLRIFFEKGSKWMSAKYSYIKFKEIDRSLFDYIGFSEYDGIETIHGNFDYAYIDLAKNFLKDVNTNEDNLSEEFKKFKELSQIIEESRKRWNTK